MDFLFFVKGPFIIYRASSCRFRYVDDDLFFRWHAVTPMIPTGTTNHMTGDARGAFGWGLRKKNMLAMIKCWQWLMLRVTLIYRALLIDRGMNIFLMPPARHFLRR